MVTTTVGVHIATIRGPLKLDRSDIRLTDRDIYANMVSVRDILVKRSDSKLKLMSKDSLFKPVCVELEEVDVISCCLECYKVKSDCRIKRTKKKLPKMVEGDAGVIIFYVSSIDGSQELTKTTRLSYAKKIQKSTHKYDTSLYYWIENEYAYFPDITWEAVLISAYFDENLLDCKDKDAACKNMQDMEFKIPKDLIDPMYKEIWLRLGVTHQIPTDKVPNKDDQG